MFRWSADTPERVEDYRIGSGPDTTVLDALVEIGPLYHFPLLRDLVVDMTPFVEKLRDVGAALTPRTDGGRYAQVSSTAPERQEIDEAIECIGCGMCLSACTIVAHNGRFPGPAALNRAFTLELDSRDGGRQARWRVLHSDDALARCHGQGNCTAVCPMGLAPMRSIIRLRQRAPLRLALPATLASRWMPGLFLQSCLRPSTVAGFSVSN